MQAVSTSFNSLESRISEVGRTAIRIGEQLEAIDKIKSRATDAHDLIAYYFDFAKGDTTKYVDLYQFCLFSLTRSAT